MKLGYVFAIHDPLKKAERRELQASGMTPQEASEEVKDIVYVGFAHTPWVSIQRLILEPPNEAFKEYLDTLYEQNPSGLIIPGVEVIDVYFGDLDYLPYDVLEDVGEGMSKRTYLEWSVLEEISVDAAVSAMQEANEGRKVVSPWPKFKWVTQMTKRGHQLFNRAPGRPKGKKTARPTEFAKQEN